MCSPPVQLLCILSYKSWHVEVKRKSRHCSRWCSPVWGHKFHHWSCILYLYWTVPVSLAACITGNFLQCRCHQYNLISISVSLRHALVVTSQIRSLKQWHRRAAHHMQKGTRLSPSLLFVVVIQGESLWTGLSRGTSWPAYKHSTERNTCGFCGWHTIIHVLPSLLMIFQSVKSWEPGMEHRAEEALL